MSASQFSSDAPLTERLGVVAQLARQLLDAHGLADWQFAYNRRKCAMGMCWYQRRLIELSSHFVGRNLLPEIRETLLHEIAHALVGARHGHDAVWKRKCAEIGARPERLCRIAVMPEGRWRAECGGCGRRFHRHRRPKRIQGWYCLACGQQRGGLVWSLS